MVSDTAAGQPTIERVMRREICTNRVLPELYVRILREFSDKIAIEAKNS